MTIKYKFDAEKAVEVLLYVAEKSSNIYNALKVLYYADREHLAKYGRLICGDSYVAMSHGAVPSGAYDLIKYARGDGFCWPNIPIEEAFTVQGYNIVPRRRANLDLLSESDVECLNTAIAQYGHLPFRRLRAICHNDAAYKAADENDVIPLEAIVRTLPDGELLLDYLQNS